MLTWDDEVKPSPQVAFTGSSIDPIHGRGAVSPSSLPASLPTADDLALQPVAAAQPATRMLNDGAVVPNVAATEPATPPHA